MRRPARLLAFAITALAACAPPKAPKPGPVVATAYEVVPSADEATLSVTARLGPGGGDELSVDDLAEPFVRDVRVDGRAVAPKGTSWIAPSCAGGCTVTYTYALRDAATALSDVDRALLHRGVVVAPPSTWLLRPLAKGAHGPFELSVKSDRFASGFFGPGPVWHADTSDLPDAPYAAFGPMAKREVRVGEGVLDVRIAPGSLGVPERELLAWVERSSTLVADYYGRFPAPRVLVVLLPIPGRELMGKTLGNGGASIVFWIGESATRADLDDDWVMPHELIHTALPSVPMAQRWFEEGLSTYVEPIARFRAGNMTREALWYGLFGGLPNGLPDADDRGLDRTPTWGRTYWGGALFCLVADVEIRKATDARLGLEDALRAILREQGNVGVRRGMREVLATGDRATGTRVLTDLYDAWRETPVRVDLVRLARELGLRSAGKGFDDGANLAHVRRAIEGVSRNEPVDR